MSAPSGVRILLRLVGGATVAGLVLAGSLAMATNFASTRHTQHIEVDAEGLASVVARTDVGDVRVEQVGGSPGRVQVEVEQRGSWRLPDFEHRREGGRLTLDGTCHGQVLSDCSTDLVIRVPAGLVVDVRTSVGDVAIAGGFEQVELATSAGDLSARDLRVDRLLVTSSLGDVDVRLAAPADLVDVRSEVGDVRVVVPDGDTAYAVGVETSLGDNRTTVPVDAGSAHAIRVTSNVGDVRVLNETDLP